MTADIEKGLRYELGMAHEASGAGGKALYQLQQVQRLDPDYRDVDALVARLSSEVAPEEDPLPEPVFSGLPVKGPEAKGRKAGYV